MRPKLYFHILHQSHLAIMSVNKMSAPSKEAMMSKKAVKRSLPPPKIKEKKRRIKSEWFTKFPWLKHKDSEFFCELCIDSGRRNIMTVGKSSANPKMDDFSKHANTADHKFAVCSKIENKSESMKKATTNAFDNIKAAIISVMKNVYFIAKEDIAKGKVEKLNKHCIFQGCKALEALTVDDRVKYTSYNSINDMLHSISSVIKDEMIQQIHGAKFYSLLFDESTDVSVTQTLMIYVRYVHQGNVVTRFLSVGALHGCTALDIHEKIKETLASDNLNPLSLISLGTDGASTMTGTKSGVATRLKEDNPFILSDHCGAHRLALAAGQAAKKIPYMVDYQGTVNAFCKLFKYSPKEKNAMKDIQEIVNDDQLSYHEVFQTRWLSFNTCVQAMRRTIDSILTYLASSSNVKAQCMMKKVGKYKFLANTYLLSDSLDVLAQLCKVLQKSNLLYSEMQIHARATIDALKALKENLLSGIHYNTLREMIPDDLDTKDHFMFFGHTISYSKKQDQDVVSCAKQFLQNAIDNLEKRFFSEDSDTAMFVHFEILVPNNVPDSESDLPEYGKKQIKKLCAFFGQEQNNKHGQVCKPLIQTEELKQEWQLFKYFMFKHKDHSCRDFWKMVLLRYQDSYPNLSFLGRIYLTLPSTTVDVERGFSRHNLVKTALRNQLKTENVSDLLIIKIEGPEEEQFDFEGGFTTWCTEKDRRAFVPSIAHKLQASSTVTAPKALLSEQPQIVDKDKKSDSGQQVLAAVGETRIQALDLSCKKE